ncbi:MAG: DUF5989 family protein [Bacteroidota bacterium]
MSFLLELVAVLGARKKYRLLPTVVVMVLVQGPAVAPFIYTLF